MADYKGNMTGAQIDALKTVPQSLESVESKLDNISQELGNLSAIFSGITAQDITDEYNAE